MNDTTATTDTLLTALTSAQPAADFEARLLAQLAADPASALFVPSKSSQPHNTAFLTTAFASAVLIVLSVTFAVHHAHQNTVISTEANSSTVRVVERPPHFASPHQNTVISTEAQRSGETRIFTATTASANGAPPYQPGVKRTGAPGARSLRVGVASETPGTAHHATTGAEGAIYTPDTTAALETRAPSRLAPPLPITADEQALRRLAQRSHSFAVASLETERRERADYDSFFNPPPPVLDNPPLPIATNPR